MTPRLTKSFAVASVAMLLGTVSATSVVSSAGAQPAGGSHVERRHKPPRHHHKSRIPQHNGGDRDADNNGGPSDGDGNV